jgi:hypothetical protein
MIMRPAYLLVLAGHLFTGLAGAAEFPPDLAFGRPQFSYYDRPALSPDGKHLAFAIVTRAKEPAGILTLPSGVPILYIGHRLHLAGRNGGPATPVGPEGAFSFNAAWSPDSTKLALSYAWQPSADRVVLWPPALGRAHRQENRGIDEEDGRAFRGSPLLGRCDELASLGLQIEMELGRVMVADTNLLAVTRVAVGTGGHPYIALAGEKTAFNFAFA